MGLAAVAGALQHVPFLLAAQLALWLGPCSIASVSVDTRSAARKTVLVYCPRVKGFDGRPAPVAAERWRVEWGHVLVPVGASSMPAAAW